MRAANGRTPQCLLQTSDLLDDVHYESEVTLTASAVCTRRVAEQCESIGKSGRAGRSSRDKSTKLHRSHGQNVTAVALRVACEGFRNV